MEEVGLELSNRVKETKIPGRPMSEARCHVILIQVSPTKSSRGITYYYNSLETKQLRSSKILSLRLKDNNAMLLYK